MIMYNPISKYVCVSLRSFPPEWTGLSKAHNELSEAVIEDYISSLVLVSLSSILSYCGTRPETVHC
jgi:hypothetical protein